MSRFGPTLPGFPPGLLDDSISSQLGLIPLVATGAASYSENLTDTIVSSDASTSLATYHNNPADTIVSDDSGTADNYAPAPGHYTENRQDTITSLDNITNIAAYINALSDTIISSDSHVDASGDAWLIVPLARRYPHNVYRAGVENGIPGVGRRTIHTNFATLGTLTTNGTGDNTALVQTAMNNAATAYLASGATHATRTIQEVVLPTGTLRFAAQLNIPGSGVVLKGQDNSAARPNRTSLTRMRFDLPGGSVAIRMGRQNFYNHNAALGPWRLAADVARLATTFQVSNADGVNIVVGDKMCMDEEFDSSIVWMGDGNAAGWYGRRQPGGSDGNGPQLRGLPPGGTQSDDPTFRRFITHILNVTNVSVGATNTTITVAEPIPMAFRTAFFAEVWHSTTENSSGRPAMQGIQFAGFENLYITGGNFKFQSCANCWVDNVEFDGNPGTANIGTYTNQAGISNNSLNFFHSYRCEVRRSWVHHSRTIQQNAGAYLVVFANYSSHCLFEDNIAIFGNKCITANVSGGGNVVLGNYVDNASTNSNGWQEGAIDLCHNSYTHNFLVEANRSTNAVSDTTHGNAGYHVYYRNRLTGENTGNSIYGAYPYTSYTAGDQGFMRAGGHDGYSGPSTYIGNVMDAGTPGGGESRRYEISTAGVVGGSHPQWAYPAVFRIGDGTNGGGNQWDNGTAGFSPYPPLPTALSLTYRDYNYDNVNQAVVRNPGSTDPLPPSLFYDLATPAFMAGFVWPPVNPDGGSNANRFKGLPAYSRYLGVGTYVENPSDTSVSVDSHSETFVDHSFNENLTDTIVSSDSSTDVKSVHNFVESRQDTIVSVDSLTDLQTTHGTYTENLVDTILSSDVQTASLFAAVDNRLDTIVSVDVVSDIYIPLPRPSNDSPGVALNTMASHGADLLGACRALLANAPLINGPQAEGRATVFTRNSLAYFEDDDEGVYVAGVDIGRYRDKGILLEEASTNLLANSRDASTGSWIKANVTALRNQIGKDGQANTAASLTATGANGTCLQAVVNASSAKTASCYVRRLVGTGTIEVTINGGSTWTNITSLLTSGLWVRVTLSATLANPSFGFRIGTNGNSIAIDHAQVEEKTYATSPIVTAGSATGRVVDSLAIPSYGFPLWEGSVELTYTPLWTTRVGTSTIFNGADGTKGMVITATSTTLVAVIRVGGVDTTVTANTSWVAGTSYRIRVTYGAGIIRLYRNGSLLGSAAGAAPGSWPTNVVIPGSDAFVKFFQVTP